RPSGRWIEESRVARGDQDAAARVERVREVVAQAAVLAGRDAGRAALTDPADVHGAPRGIHGGPLRRACGGVRDVRVHDVDVTGLALEVGHARGLRRLVPDD